MRCENRRFLYSVVLRRHFLFTSLVFLPEEGSYSVFTEQGKLLDLDKSELLELKYVNNRVLIKSLDKDYGSFKKVRFVGTSYKNSFKIKFTSRGLSKY